MNRRGFLGVLAAAVAGTAFDPERALWVPGRKLITFGPLYKSPVFGMDFDFSDPNLTMGIEEFQRKYIEPAVRAMEIEMYEHLRYGMNYPPGFHRDAFVLGYPRLGA